MHKDLYSCPRKATELRCTDDVQTQQGAPAPAPKTLGSFAQQVLDALVPNEESILRLAGMAGNGAAAGAGRVPSEGSGGEAHSTRCRRFSQIACNSHDAASESLQTPFLALIRYLLGVPL